MDMHVSHEERISAKLSFKNLSSPTVMLLSGVCRQLCRRSRRLRWMCLVDPLPILQRCLTSTGTWHLTTGSGMNIISRPAQVLPATVNFLSSFCFFCLHLPYDTSNHAAGTLRQVMHQGIGAGVASSQITTLLSPSLKRTLRLVPLCPQLRLALMAILLQA